MTNFCLNINAEYKIVYKEKSCKPLCFIGDKLLIFKKGKIFQLDLHDYTKKYICSLEMGKKQRYLSKSRLISRLLRLEPRGIIKMDEETILLSYKGSLYRLDVKGQKAEHIHSFRIGMSAPLSLARIENIDGFCERYCYGEYFSNPEKKEVKIYGTDKNGFDWHEIYCFPDGAINHIHSIIPDPYQNKVWVFTGDFGEEAGIWFTDDDFKTMKRYLTGKQQYRSCVGFPTAEGLIFATDTPLEENFIYLVSREKKLERICTLEGPSIYGTEFGDKFLLSTVVEGHSDEKRRRWELISYKRGQGVKSRYCELLIGNLIEGFSKLGRYKKDFLPMGLMQFGTISFPSDYNPTDKIVFCGIAIKEIEGTLCIMENMGS